MCTVKKILILWFCFVLNSSYISILNNSPIESMQINGFEYIHIVVQSSLQSNFTFLSLKRNLVHIFIHSVFSILNPLKASTNLFLSVHSCLFWIFYINVIIQFVVSVTVFFSLDIMFPDFIHVLAFICIPFHCSTQ